MMSYVDNQNICESSNLTVACRQVILQFKSFVLFYQPIIRSPLAGMCSS